MDSDRCYSCTYNLFRMPMIPDKRHAPIMFTTDLALKEDPGFRKISERFLKNPKEFDAAFARAWFKLTHRDLGPRCSLSRRAKFLKKCSSGRIRFPLSITP